MPCNIGYKSYTEVKIPTPQPEIIRKRAQKPDLDADLMAKLGVNDPAFLGWLQELDTNPLLVEALKRALQATNPTMVTVTLTSEGVLETVATVRSSREKKQAANEIAAVVARWQMEILAIVAQLLDYCTTMRQENDGWILEGEHETDTGVHEYLQVRNQQATNELRFEHFRTAQECDLAQDKFLALAQRLGVKIRVVRSEKGGQPIAAGTVHRDFLHE